jgi:hypothetical protein
MIQINIRNIIRSQKNKTVARLPGFVINLIRWWVKENELNELLRKTSHLKDFEFVEALNRELDLHFDIKGLENIPKKNNLIFVGNHALGGIDFFALVHALKQAGFTKINHPANEVLSNIKPLNGLLVPINVFNKITEKDRNILEKKLSDNTIPVTMFPSGEVMRKYNGKPDDGLWRSGFVRYAKQYKKDVIPFYIPTENSKIFYRIASWRRRLKIKANIELFWLSRELLKQRGKTIRIIFGKPIPWQQFDDSKNRHEWAAEVKKIAYQLGNIKL